MAGPPLPAELVRALASGATVVTANQRAARTLRRRVDLEHRARGEVTWEPPAILAWESWTAALWGQLLLSGRATALLLNQAQEHSVWRGAIAADAEANGLLTPDALAELAAEAFATLVAHGGEGRLSRASGADTRAFARWTEAFLARCGREDLLPAAQLEGRLVQTLRAAERPAALLLVGFDSLTPARKALLDRLRSLGTRVDQLAPEQRGRLALTATSNEDEDLTMAARWLQARLAEQPATSLALIVPGLESRRAEIERMLTRELPLGSFEFSLGLPLSRVPAVAVALDLLRWPGEGLPRERLTRLLLSPVLGGHQAERLGRAAADARLRRERTLQPEMALDRLARTLDTARTPMLRRALSALSRAAEEIAPTVPRSFADSAETMRRLLRAAGWGEGADSLTFQAMERWEAVLDEAATLDFAGVRVSYPEALATVERLATDTLFAPESVDAPVQILGPLESAGSSFAAVWFLGAGDLTWPRAPATSPLLTWSLQRELGLPCTDSAADLAHARDLAERIARSAAVVVFSYAREVGEQGHQRASPGLTQLQPPETRPDALVPTTALREPLLLETLDDSHTLPSLPDAVLRGGSSILQDQAACGFRAFAQHRLFASALDGTRPAANFGFDARDSGGAIHKVLQLLWTRWGDQATLKALSPDERHTVVGECIEQTLGPIAARNPGRWDAAYLALQSKRLRALLDRWLSKEMEREVPFKVRALERRMEDVPLGPLRLTLQVDRIDETVYGDVILDYKTGRASPTDWLGERPEAPQLPLYAVLASAAPEAAPLAGLAFAHLRAGNTMTLEGVESQPGLLLKTTALGQPLGSQLDAWRTLLEGLAGDFYRGDVRVRPKAYPHTCQYCEQRLLCRLDVSLLHADEEEDEQDAEGDHFG